MTRVPCNGCTACCKRDRIVIDPSKGDDAKAYRWHWNQQLGKPGADMVLDRKPDGECVYLTETGCGIHGRAPAVCRAFDCRAVVQSTSAEWRAMRVEQNPSLGAVYEAGQRRLRDRSSHTSALTACATTAAEYSAETTLTAVKTTGAFIGFPSEGKVSIASPQRNNQRLGG